MTGVGLLSTEAGQEVPSRPEWLGDELEVVAVLNAFLDKLDQKPMSERTRVLSITLTRGLAPALHKNDESADRTWALLRSLEGLIFEVRTNRKRQPYDPEYIGASLRFLEGAEDICRAWLSRPRQKSYQAEWRSAVEAQSAAFSDEGTSLLDRPVRIPGKTAAEVVEAFTHIAACAKHHLTLRQLSARVFWGNSKVLDTREDLLRQLYPSLEILPRPILIHVFLPAVCKGILFIENQDTYVQALFGRPDGVEGLALVYAAGFRGSAERVRERNGASMHYQAGSDHAAQDQFEAWWFAGHKPAWPVWFWGDLDYSGMAILKSLRQRFGDVEAWPDGYAPLLACLQNGEGHAPDLASKAEQADPGATGCTYADETLLLAIRGTGTFIDQEFI